MCLSGITWSGFKRIYYFFGYEDTKNAFNIPHDLKILQSVFGKTGPYYNAKNEFFQSFDIMKLIQDIGDSQHRTRLMHRVNDITKAYDKLSSQYQSSKSNNEIPLN